MLGLIRESSWDRAEQTAGRRLLDALPRSVPAQLEQGV